MEPKSKNCHHTGTNASKEKNLHVESAYDDGNIPDVDLNSYENVEPLPESSRPRQDGPGGN